MIPCSWEAVPIGSFAYVRRGASPRPIGDPKYFSEFGRGWVRIADVTSTKRKLRKTTQYLSELGVSKSVPVNPGDLIMSICATLGKPIVVDMQACIHDGFVLFSNFQNSIITDYFFYTLQRLENSFKAKGQAGTQKNLNTNLVRKTYIPLPPLPEQRKIAKILSTVDESIEKTDAIIEETRQLKKGLMQKLFTEGIGHTRFKDTKIGRIPEEWVVKRIKEIGDVKGGKRVPKGQKLVSENTGYPYLKAGELKRGTVIADNVEYLLPKTYEKIKRYIINSTDVYITVVGAYIGDVGIIPTKYDGANLTENANKICHLKGVLKEYLAYFLSSSGGQTQIMSFIGVGAQPKLALYRIEKISVPIPSIDEQRKIVEIISLSDKKLENEEAYKTELEQLKRGLMQVLLTGKVRVKVNEKEKEAEA